MVKLLKTSSMHIRILLKVVCVLIKKEPWSEGSGRKRTRVRVRVRVNPNPNPNPNP